MPEADLQALKDKQQADSKAKAAAEQAASKPTSDTSAKGVGTLSKAATAEELNAASRGGGRENMQPPAITPGEPPAASVLGADMGQALPLSKSDREHAKRLGVDSRAYAQMKVQGQLGGR